MNLNRLQFFLDIKMVKHRFLLIVLLVEFITVPIADGEFSEQTLS